jgi:ribA/ribD-fused uncharacterized protein
MSIRPSDKYSELLEKLPVQTNTGKPIISFYGQNNKNGFMSNFFPCTFKVPTSDLEIPEIKSLFDSGITFTNSEQAFMFEKGLIFYDRNPVKNLETLNKIVIGGSPGHVKKLGRQVICLGLDGKFDQKTWDIVRCKCMYNACWYKFSQNKELAKMLLNTGDAHLVEATQNDLNWGNGLHINDKKLHEPKQWNGLNLLGEVLMVVRDELKQM